jgi:hypothetical protein
MRKIGACTAIAAFGLILAAPAPAAAFGFHIGPFHFGFPFHFRHHSHFGHRLYMRADPNDLVRPGPAPEPELAPASPGPTSTPSALIHPGAALPSIFQNIFWPTYSSTWPFGYAAIFSTAFAKVPADQDALSCKQQPDVATAILSRIRNEVSPTPAQQEPMQKLGGALRMASGFLARSCPSQIPQQPTARLQLMQSQIEVLTMALDIIRQPLADFEQSLDESQRARFAAVGPVPPAAAAAPAAPADPPADAGPVASTCGGSPRTIDWSVSQIGRSVQPQDSQRGALDELKQAFDKAASDLDAHCPTSVPANASGRLEAIQARLDATWRAELSFQVALSNFESKLTDDQKNRFDAMTIAAR